LSLPDGPRLSDSIASKIIQGGFPSNLDGLRFNSALNIWEFVPFGGGGGANTLNYSGSEWLNNASSANRFVPCNSHFDSVAAVEGQAQTRMYQGVTLTDFGVQILGNGKATDYTMTWRDDGVNVVGSTITITAGVNGYFEVTGFSTAIADNSLCNLMGTGGTSGGIRMIATSSRLTVP